MKICGKCNLEYDDGLNFCSKCGKALTIKPQEFFCPACGKLLCEKVDLFCPYCGNQIKQTQNFSSISQHNNTDNNINVCNTFHHNKHYDSVTPESSNADSYFSKEYLFSFKGRRGRAAGFITSSILSLLLIGIILLGAVNHSNGLVYLAILLGCVVVWAMIANDVKRVHDFGKSGLWLLGCFVAYTVIGALVQSLSQDIHALLSIIVPNLIFIPKGTNGPNKYGA